jgi:hypothetical protein
MQTSGASAARMRGHTLNEGKCINHVVHALTSKLMGTDGVG